MPTKQEDMIALATLGAFTWLRDSCDALIKELADKPLTLEEHAELTVLELRVQQGDLTVSYRMQAHGERVYLPHALLTFNPKPN